jgi:transposase
MVSETGNDGSKSTAIATGTAALLEQLKSQLPAPWLKAVSDQLNQFQDTVLTYENKLYYAELKIRVLEERLRLQRIAKYGPGSEKLSDEQLDLLELEPGVSTVEVEAESKRAALPPKVKTSLRHPGRQTLPADLPRVEQIIGCPAEQCVCRSCGQETKVIGYEESEQLDVKPAQYFVRVTRREKRACKRCEENGVVTAPLPPRIIEKGLVSDELVIDTIINKYADHCPLYRQSVILQRDAGVEVSRATMDGWVLQVGELLIPITAAMRQELINSAYLQADETPVPVQMQDGRGKHHQAYLWQYGSPGGTMVFDFRLGRGRDGPRQFLGSFHGILQTDGYAAYDRVGDEGVVHAACWAHAIRKFKDAVKVNPADRAAITMVTLIEELFAIDARAREQQLDQAARHQLRQEYAPALLKEIRQQIEVARKSALPASVLAKACDYTVGLWPRLICFLEHPELELSNNWAENSMRPIAVGRKNWLHVGSAQAGPKIAAILSIIESCRRLKIPVRDYLRDVLPGLADAAIQSVAELTPVAWAARHR